MQQQVTEPQSIQTLSAYKDENGFSHLEIAKRFGAKTAQEAVKWINSGWLVVTYPNGYECLTRVMRDSSGGV
jgi:hypothetical protein